jgi:cold shock CspA family protein
LLKEKKEKQIQKKTFEESIAYIDENGNFTETPPDRTKRTVIKAEDIVIGIPTKENDNSDPVKSGKIDFYNDEKGYGFIKEDLTNEKYFVHVSSLNGEIGENDKVSFELEKGPKGLNAVRVNKI